MVGACLLLIAEAGAALARPAPWRRLGLVVHLSPDVLLKTLPSLERSLKNRWALVSFLWLLAAAYP